MTLNLRLTCAPTMPSLLRRFQLCSRDLNKRLTFSSVTISSITTSFRNFPSKGVRVHNFQCDFRQASNCFRDVIRRSITRFSVIEGGRVVSKSFRSYDGLSDREFEIRNSGSILGGGL